MCSICGLDCCKECSRREECGGCQKVDGHPFGGTCIAAECIKRGGQEEFLKLKELHLLNGFFVNLEYPLANGQSVKLLEDKKIYLGNQIERPGSDRCYGIVADESYLLVCEYGCNGTDPEIIIYKKRNTV